MTSTRRDPLRIGTSIIVCALGFGCASSLPAVLTSTSDSVAVEFAVEGSLAEATALAKQECEKSGKAAKFEEVKRDATPDSRVARFSCVGAGSGAVAAQPGAAETTPPVSAPSEEIPLPEDADADATEATPDGQ